jgi:hypothetical protein
MHIADLDRQLKSYLDAGGHLIWIGGAAKPAPCLIAVNEAMARTEKQSMPTTEMLRTDDSLEKTRLVLKEKAGEVAGENKGANSWAFIRPPALGVGWTQPLSPWRFDSTSKELEPLLVLDGPDATTLVGVLWKSPKTDALQGAWLPVYSLAPHLLVKSDIVANCSEPQLDAPAMQILTSVLDRLDR